MGTLSSGYNQYLVQVTFIVPYFGVPLRYILTYMLLHYTVGSSDYKFFQNYDSTERDAQ